jgi:hypothetical protein
MKPLGDWQAVLHAADFSYDLQKDAKGGDRYLSYFPFVEPWAFLVFTIFLLLLAVFCFSSLFLWPLPKLVHALPVKIQNIVNTVNAYAPSLRALIVAIVVAALLFIVLWLVGLR